MILIVILSQYPPPHVKFRWSVLKNFVNDSNDCCKRFQPHLPLNSYILEYKYDYRRDDLPRLYGKALYEEHYN